MQERTFKIREGASGTTRELTGNPDLLTLDDVLVEVGKQGGQKWDRNQVRLKAGGREFGERDLHRTFSSIGIVPGDVIEIVEPVTS